jgi:hypothetical protein
MSNQNEPTQLEAAVENPKRKKDYRHVHSTHPPGRQSQIGPAEASAITALAVSGMPGTEIARRLGRSKQTVSRVLNSEEAKKARELAKSLLIQNASEFAQNWIKAAKVAADKGRFEASKEALVAIGAIEDRGRSEQKGFVVKIGVMLPGLGSAPNANLVMDVADFPALPPTGEDTAIQTTNTNRDKE